MHAAPLSLALPLAASLLTAPLLLGAATTAAGPARTAAGTVDEDSEVRVTLLAEVDRVRAGEEFLVGLRYTIEPHWHIYWKNPGDSGMPTTATLDAPEGFTVGPLLFPGPERITMPGDIVNFGYEDEVVLFWTVTAPEDLGDAREFRFHAKSDWLMCEEICIPGDGEGAVTLPRAADGDEVARDREAFRASLDRLPRPIDALEGAAARWEGTPDAPVLALEVPGSAPVTWFPEAEESLAFEREAVEAGEERTTIRRWYSLDLGPDDAAPRIRGVLAIEHEDATAFYELDLSRTAEEEPNDR